MNKEISPVAKSILILLNNAEELIRISNDRKNAKDVVKAAVVYANSKNFPIPEQEIDSFNEKILDYKPNILSEMIREIASIVINSEFSTRIKKK